MVVGNLTFKSLIHGGAAKLNPLNHSTEMKNTKTSFKQKLETVAKAEAPKDRFVRGGDAKQPYLDLLSGRNLKA